MQQPAQPQNTNQATRIGKMTPEQKMAELVWDAKVIKGWVIIMGVLHIVTLVAGIVFAINLYNEVSCDSYYC